MATADVKPINAQEVVQHQRNIETVLNKIKEIEKLKIDANKEITVEGKSEKELEQMRADLKRDIAALQELSSDEIADALISINALYQIFEQFQIDLPKYKASLDEKK